MEVDSRRFGPDSAFLATGQRLKRDVEDVMYSGKYPVTPAVCRELRHIDTGVNLMKLDQDLVGSCQSWGNKFDPQATLAEQQAMTGTMGRAVGTMSGFKGQFSSERTDAQSDNQRLATQSLRGIQQDMAPYTHQSEQRLKQFCDYMGVTDRYTGYRHNLSRGSRDPVRLGFSWLNDNNQQATNNNMWKPAFSCSSATTGHVTQSPVRQAFSAPQATTGMRHSMYGLHTFCVGEPHYPQPRSLQEQCGINTTFPGHSETTLRFQPPAATTQSSRGYTINPRPDYGVHGRPLAHILYERGRSEYQTRYEWPDGRKITKLPWLRK